MCHIINEKKQTYITFWLLRGADIEHTTPDSITPLMIASRFGNLDCVSLLLRRGADVRKTDNDEKTVLMLAAEENREDALKVGFLTAAVQVIAG